MSRRHGPTRLQYQTLGLVFLVVCVLFFAGTIGVYNKAFTPYVLVTLETDRAGNQMREGGDVKVRGAVVGEVRSIRQTTRSAVLELAIQPDSAPLIPKNVAARLRPKTLFGERYVDLRIPEESGSASLADGDVITQDRSAESVEVEQVLGDLMPLLQAVQPHKLATTLSAVSQAVDGRGEALGHTLVDLNAYLHELDPALPDLEEVIKRAERVSHVYADAAPDLLQAMSDFSVTSRTITEHRQRLAQTLDTVTRTSNDLNAFLKANQGNMIRLNAESRPSLELLERYAPEYPCMLTQFVDSIPAAEAAFGKGYAIPANRVTIEITASRGKYVPGKDTPRYLDQRGPRCYQPVHPPGRFPQYPPGGPIDDGSYKPPPERTSPITGIPLVGGAAGTSPQAAPGPSTPLVAGSHAEQNLIAALVAPSMEVPPSEVPRWSPLLVGPLYRGAEVTLR